MAGLIDTSYDTEIQATLSYSLSAIEYSIGPAALGNTSNAGLQALLRLGATEIVAGDIAAQIRRRDDFHFAITINELSIRPSSFNEFDPTGLKAQGWARIKPYLRSEAHAEIAAFVISGGNKQGTDEQS